MRIKKILVIICLMFFSTTLYGCYDYSEIENESFVYSLGIDKVNDSYQISAETLNMNDFGTDISAKPKIVLSKGDTLFKAMDNLNNSFYENLNLSHCELIIIGEDMSKSGINDVLNLVFEKNKLRFNTLLSTTVSGSANELMNKNKSDSLSSNEILTTLKDNDVFNKNCRIYNVINTIKNNKPLILPAINYNEQENNKNFNIEKISVFKDGMLDFMINKEDMTIYSFLTNHKGIYQLHLNNGLNVKTQLKKTSLNIKNDTLIINMDFKGYLEDNQVKEENNKIQSKIEEQIQGITKEFLNNLDNKYAYSLLENCDNNVYFNIQNKLTKKKLQDYKQKINVKVTLEDNMEG